MNFSYQALRDGHFITGDDNAHTGQFDPTR